MSSDTVVKDRQPPFRSAPAGEAPPRHWLSLELVGNVLVASVLLLCLLPLWNWGVRDAVWTGDQAACQQAGAGACWAYVAQKSRFFLLGFYPAEQQWRPVLGSLVILALVGASVTPRFWRPALLGAWLAGVVVFFWLMAGGLGLPMVSSNLWSGLPVTLMLTAFALAFGFPLGALLALGRSSDFPLIRIACTVWIETIRGLPFISILFMANILLPLFLPAGVDIDKLLRVQLAFILLASAYIAEVVRGGLQSIPKGQREAAAALGLGYWRCTLLVVLPQALRLVIPSLVNTSIAFLKDTSLIVVIGLFDLLGTVKAANSDSAWLGHATEGYLTATVIYFLLCFSLSRFGTRLERRNARLGRSTKPAADPA
ncbi:amino acid ABC transporter permease [Paracoccus aminophilus]|uniref:General L-amino acid transport system permease protein n=1 Tax=Paracoccus aminophilus JCM 7686 TaxID=1367847 RepID=S5YGR7_PARAH|nr:amino acid ABC transporter permease [Paracoccus aminophilus]AGT10658.1 general L-amino acid transport system permease protein [Paracoccus aminophilus JCM 7686]